MCVNTPEDLFDRFVRGEGYFGRLRLLDAEEGLRGLLADIRMHMNDMFGVQRLRLQVDGAHPKLHFDLIDDCDEVNALAFAVEGWSIVGVTQSLFRTLQDVFAMACQNREFVASFGDAATPPQPIPLFTLLYLTAFQFVSAHELGHHVHGHLGLPTRSATAVRKEFSVASGGSHLASQAEEVEADGYAVHMVLGNMLRGGPRAHAAQLLGGAEDQPGIDETLLRVFMAAVVCFFHAVHQPFDAGKVDERSHPFELSRINTVITDMHGWCAGQEPTFPQWPDVPQFVEFGATLRGVLRATGIEDHWDDQSRFVQCKAGQDYRVRLYEEREALRARMESFRWSVLPESSSAPPPT
jgi:hypothetical protein